MNKAIFLDRDGTLIIDYIYLNDPDKVEYLQGVFSALALLQKAGYIFMVVTNQSGIPRGLVTVDNLHKIHQKIENDFLHHGITINDFYYAPYLPESNHYLRKPNTGMLDLAITKYNIDVTKSWMIGDQMSDVEAGHRAGMRSILLTSGTHQESIFQPPEAVVTNLLEAANVIMQY